MAGARRQGDKYSGMANRPRPARGRAPQGQKVKEAQVFALVLGAVIERLRRHHSWTQAQLAEKVGASQPVISRIEKGRIQPDAFLYGRLAAAFGLTVQDLQQRVNNAMNATKRAAEAVSPQRAKSWDDVAGVVGTLGLIGLVFFAVAALLEDGVKGPGSKG